MGWTAKEKARGSSGLRAEGLALRSRFELSCFCFYSFVVEQLRGWALWAQGLPIPRRVQDVG